MKKNMGVAAAGGRKLKVSAKSVAKRPGNTREKTCRQTLVVLQHDKEVREASEFRSHGSCNSSFCENRQSVCRKVCIVENLSHHCHKVFA